MNLNELEPVKQLAVAQAIYKAVGAVVSTKDPDSLRSACDREAVRRYDPAVLKDGFNTLPDGEEAGDLDGTFRHELGHALGISSAREPILNSKGKTKEDAGPAWKSSRRANSSAAMILPAES